MSWSDPTAMDGVPAYTDSALYDPNLISGIQSEVSYANGQRLPADQMPINQLVRRSTNHQLTSRACSVYGQVGQTGRGHEDNERLEAQALRARKGAQAKRKQIPPFLQKLGSFLDDSNYTDLIRWSDDGNSFIVLNKDEFAKTLIPELFKHNNYASFVRQLNMYGFRKKVGLSDNSMKQAERRDRKTPSEYFNKYFKRGRPELIWLIQKPKKPQSDSKRKINDDKKHSSGDYTRNDVDWNGIDSAAKEMQLISKSDYTTIRNEIRQIQQQQKLISSIIQRMRRQDEQWYQQASQFQKMHKHHEDSINAILTFLATFCNRSLEDQNGVNMNMADMFPSTISQTNHNQSSVVDMGDYLETNMSKKSPAPLSHLETADGKTSLTQQQREYMLSLKNAATPTRNGKASTGTNNASTGTNNAFINPQPPQMPTPEHFGDYQGEADMLQRLQEEQAACVHNLSEWLAFMSPGDSISDMTAYSSYEIQANRPSSDFDFDFDSFIQTDPDNSFVDAAPASTSANGESNITRLPADNTDFDFGNFDGNGVFPAADQIAQLETATRMSTK